ncbi:MAG: YlqD family protein [Cyanobacteria bacterium P01_H01_bin.121]
MEGTPLSLKRNVNVKAVVTPRWKEEAQQQLQNQINQLDGQLQQLEMQGQRMVAELQQQQGGPQAAAAKQISNVQAQVQQKKSELLEQKNKILQQLQQVQLLELEQEVNQGQIESVFEITKGDNLVQKMQVEILIRDGIVEDIRGTL